ncbi:Uncharacterised protein [Mycobacteroides abscessus subsp. massiliense]|nr:Uncharacterised protein [Mycobacteroides abscessus subsp. massiliense]
MRVCGVGVGVVGEVFALGFCDGVGEVGVDFREFASAGQLLEISFVVGQVVAFGVGGFGAHLGVIASPVEQVIDLAGLIAPVFLVDRAQESLGVGGVVGGDLVHAYVVLAGRFVDTG